MKKETLLKEGIELISEHGYHGTGLKKVLDRVNIPKGSFYNYFKSKEHYVSEIIQRYSDDLMEKIEAFVERSDGDAINTIKEVYFFAAEEIGKKGEKGCLLGNLAAEIGSSNKLCGSAMKRAFERWKKVFNALIEEAQKKGTVRDDVTSDALTDILWDVWEGSLLRMRIDKDTDLKMNISILIETLYAKNNR